MEVLLDLNVFNVSFSELTSGKGVETFIEECSVLELIEWDACGRLLFKYGLIFNTSQHNFFSILKSLKFFALVEAIMATKTYGCQPQGYVYRVL